MPGVTKLLNKHKAYKTTRVPFKFIDRAVKMILKEKIEYNEIKIYEFLVRRQKDIGFPVNYDLVKEVLKELEKHKT